MSIARFRSAAARLIRSADERHHAVFNLGKDTTATSIDIDGTDRKKGIAVDMGAHEVK